MLSWSPREAIAAWWDDCRGQTEPIAAIVAVLAVGIGLTAYAGALDDTLPSSERNVAEPTSFRVDAAISSGGVVDPSALPEGLRAGPDGYGVRLTLTVDGRTWQEGPRAPPGADAVTRIVTVRVGPGVVRPGRLRVEVWE